MILLSYCFIMSLWPLFWLWKHGCRPCPEHFPVYFSHLFRQITDQQKCIKIKIQIIPNEIRSKEKNSSNKTYEVVKK